MSETTMCVANINAAGRRRRLVLGASVLLATLAAHFAFHPPITIAWILLPTPLLFGWLCVLQAAART